MSELWKRRLKAYQKLNLRYLRYVLNDHLILALLFMVGGLGFAYANWIKIISPQAWFLKPIILLVSLFFIKIKRPILLLEEPDKVFLLPQERKMNEYLKASQIYSFCMAMLVLAVGSIVQLPLLALLWHQKAAIIIYVALLVVMLIGDYQNKYRRYFFELSKANLISTIWIILSLVGSLYLSIYLGLGLSLVGVLVGMVVERVWFKAARFNWQLAINKENQRLNALLHFYNMFTPVKQIKAQHRPRRYTDFLLKVLSDPKNVYSFLFARLIIRSSNKGSLLIRLLIVGIILEVGSSIIWLKVILAMLVTYLIIIQQLDVYDFSTQNVMLQVYPITKAQAQKGLSSVLKRIILISTIVLLISGLINSYSLGLLVWLLIGQLVITVILLKWIIPNYIKKVD